MKIIARIHTDFSDKFGIPRQSGLVSGLHATIVFEPAYRNSDALRGIEEYSHLWLIWEFSKSKQEEWSPTVRPPRLGGNKRMGVFATRSPFRPNPIGLSSVKLLQVEWDTPVGPVLHVEGADILDDTPIYDVKPYLSYTDSHPDAAGGFADDVRQYALTVMWEDQPVEIPESVKSTLTGILQQDPRPSYQNDPERVYNLTFSDWEIQFRVSNGIATVIQAKKRQ